MQSVEDHENPTRSLLSRIRLHLSINSIKYLFVLPVTLFFIVFLILPVINILLTGFRDSNGNYTFQFLKEVFQDPLNIDWQGDPNTKNFEKRDITRIGETRYIFNGVDHGRILNSIIIATLSTVIALVIGSILALFMSRREFPGKKIVSALILVPLIIPPFIAGIGFNHMIGQNGILNTEIFLPYFGFKILIKGVYAMVFVQSLHYYTLIYLNVYSSLISIDPSLEEQAKNMGASGFTLMRTVVLPLALPGIAAGSILTFILSIEDVGTPLIFANQGDAIAKKTMPYYILTSATAVANNTSAIPPHASIIGIVLLLFALGGFLLIRKYVLMRSYSMISKGRAGERFIEDAKPWELAVFYISFTILFLLSTMSHIGILLLGFSDLTDGKKYPPKWTNKHFESIFSSSKNIAHAMQNTVVYSLLAIVVIIIFGTMAAYALSRLEFRGKAAFDILITIPIALPGIVLGLGYLIMFNGTKAYNLFGIQERFGVIFTFDPLIYPVILLISSFAVRKFPFAVRSIFAGLQQTSVTLEEAAEGLGASKYKAIRNITLPLITLNMLAGGLIALVYTLGEVSTTLILVSQTEDATITWIMGHSGDSQLGEFAALGILLMVVQLISIIASNILLKDKAEALTGI